MPTTKTMEKKARGTMAVCSTNEVLDISWVDSKGITLAFDSLTREPLKRCSRCCRQNKRKITIPPPFFIRQYSEHLDRVGQLNSYLNSLCPCNRERKWYWMQLINLVRVLHVAAF